MGDIVQKVTTDLTFGQNGVLVPPGTVINIDVTKGDFNDSNTPNLADVGSAVVNVPVAVAPIAPTGPNPTMPQQVGPGVFQTTAGYVAPGGALFVAEGSEAAREVAAVGQTIGDVEEEGPVRRQAAEGTGDATTSVISRQPAVVPLGSEPGKLDDAEHRELEELRQFRTQALAAGSSTVGTTGAAPVENGQNSGQTGGEGDVTFRPDVVIDGTVPEVAKRLEGLNREQLLAVKDAEQDREQPRTGVTSAIDGLIAKLDEDAAQA